MRGDQKVLQFDMTHKWHKQNFVLFFNIIALNSNTFVTSVKKLFDVSQIEFDTTQWLVSSHYHCGTRFHEGASSDDDIHGSHWVPGLVSRVDVTAV